MPSALHPLAVASLVLAALSALVVVVDLAAGHRQQMAIMNVVWPVTALWAGPLGLWPYFAIGRRGTARAARAARERGEEPPSKRKPGWQTAAVGALHCGAGCSLGDLVAEGVLASAIGSRVFGTWLLDFAVAFLLGIVFQYFAIAPMRHLSPGAGIVAALKADTLSLTAWQVGMYGWMAVVLFVLFSPEALPKSRPEFWFFMQFGMLAGFLTAWPVNAWLIRRGIKEAM